MICAAVIAASMGGPILQWRDRADACEGQTPRIESTCASACLMILWLYVCDWLDIVEDEPETKGPRPLHMPRIM
jgi:hypothetical protein